MGFGSYDESEQENQELDTEEDESEQVSRSEEADADGDVEDEYPDGGTDAMLDQLQTIKGEPEEEEE